MCGITGFICHRQNTSFDNNAVLKKMNNSLTHRGPDHDGYWVDSAHGVYLGHRRLSIIDITNLGNQPMVSKSGRFVISYNGEVYNYKEIRKELSQIGNSAWKGESDTEVILEAIDCWGLESALVKFNGMFAFALWDTQEQNLHLVRDRMGIKPLYWSQQAGCFLFGSELKSIMAYKQFKPDIEINSLALYMKYKYVPCPNTIFKNVHQLEPATILTFTKNKDVRKTKYWNLSDISKRGVNSTAPEENINEEVIELVNDAVKSRLVSDVSIGAFLSGGIDSSAIVALMQANSTQAVNTFSIGFSHHAYDESKYAKEIANYLGTNHTEYILEPQDAIDVIPKLPQIYDEPFSDSSQIPTYLVSKLTSKNVKVALSGDGGDEIFAGYNRYLYADKYVDKFSAMPTWFKKSTESLIYSLSKDSWNKLFHYLPDKFSHSQGGDKLYKLASVIGEDNFQLYQKLITNWGFEEGALMSKLKIQDVNMSIPDFFSSRQSVEYMQLMDQMNYLPNDILTKVDRASMANSLEVRVPFLDHRVVEKLWHIPREHKINNGVSKVILRKILGKHLPSTDFQRNKAGFSVPITDWLRGPLRDWAGALLDKDVNGDQGIFNREIINKKWNEHQSGKHNWHEQLWSVLMFNAWYEHWIK